MLRDLRKQVFKIFVDIKIVSLSRLDYAVDDRTGVGSIDRIDQFPVVPSDTERPDRLFSDVVVKRQCRIIQEGTQILLLVQAVLDTFLGFIAANCSILCFSRPIEESIDQWLHQFLSFLLPFRRRQLLKGIIRVVYVLYLYICFVCQSAGRFLLAKALVPVRYTHM